MKGNAMYVHGRKCWFCSSYGLFRLNDNRVKCRICRRPYSLKRLKRDLNADDFRSYKDLKQYGKHNKIKHSKTFGRKHNHINGIEGFWSYAKERFHKYHGIGKGNYLSYIKEMEFRFNNRNQDVYPLLIKIIRDFGTKIN